MELVSDHSTYIFLKRFVGQREYHKKYIATNFVDASNKLAELKNSLFTDDVIHDIKTYDAQKGIVFCFIPLRSPHFGGLYEAAVKSAKTLLSKNFSHPHLTSEELQMLVIEVEATLNSRPIAPLTDDPNDGEALTPGHLLRISQSVTSYYYVGSDLI